MPRRSGRGVPNRRIWPPGALGRKGPGAVTEAWAKDDAMATYHEACRLAADGHEGVREWFGGAKSKYAAFLDSKRPAHVATGLTRTPELADWLLPIQAATAEFALHRGRAGAFLSTGLGKTGVS